MPRSVFILILICALMAAPLCANSVTFAQPSEARAAMGTIRDRLRKKFENNGNRIDPSWRLDAVVSAGEVGGTFFERSDYTLTFPPASPDSARIECAKAFPLRDGPLVLITNLRTGEDAWQEPPIDEGQDFLKALAVALVVIIWFGVPVILTRYWMRRKDLTLKERTGHSMATAGLWLFLLGFAYLFFSWAPEQYWEQPPLAFIWIASLGFLAGVILTVLGGLAPAPRRLTGAVLHLTTALLAAAVVGLMAFSASAHVLTAVFIAIGFGAVVICSSVVRYKTG